MSQRRLEAPHRRLERGSRLLERTAVTAYRAASRLIARVPRRPAAALLGAAAQLSYLVWPTKRRWSNANFGHVLGLPPDHPRVRRLALAAYRHYGAYLVDVMRLESGVGGEPVLVNPEQMDRIDEIHHSSKGGLIFVLGHIANGEAVASVVGSRWRVNVLADDSAFPEMFEHFRQVRESLGHRVIPWRNLREIYAVLRRREMLALLIDWGYRPDGIPVRLFDAWTTLPEGPAILAARTGSRIVPVGVRRVAENGFEGLVFDPIDVASTDPAELARATQAMADALAATIAAAPEQWYSFKPLWPDTPEERRSLEARAAASPDRVGLRPEPGSP